MDPVSAPQKRSSSISAEQYRILVEQNLNGVFPEVAPPPQPKRLKHERTYPCTHPGCTYIGTSADMTKRHMGNMHGIGVEYHPCDQPGCTYVGKWVNSLRQHKQKAHDIDVTWHCCPIEGCGFRTKTTPGLRGHMATRHDIGVVWLHCQMPGCSFKTKLRSGLLQHAKHMHSGKPGRARKASAETPPDDANVHAAPLATPDIDTDSSDDEADDSGLVCLPCAPVAAACRS